MRTKMEGQSSKTAAPSTGAVFLSYASQDVEAARRICDTLRAAGIEVWFDQSELRGGDAWDRRIRQQIRDCALFVPVISASAQARAEGYFRLEWHLAEQRTHLLGRQRAFLVPVCIDDTAERDADVPDAFLAVQWTRLPTGAPTTPLVGVVQRLLGLQPAPAGAAPAAIKPAAAEAVAHPPVRQPVSPIELRQAPERSGSGRFGAKRWILIGGLLLVLVAAALVMPWWQRGEHARNVLLPAIEDTLATAPRSNAHLLGMALEAERALPHDRSLARLWPLIAAKLTIETQPAGAGVYWKDYGTFDAPWQFAGTTPLKDARVPRNLLRVEIRKEGFQTIELVSPRPWTRAGSDVPRLTLDRVGSLPPGMVRIPASISELLLQGLNKYGGVDVPEFLADKHEVTNRQYKAFVNAGGYANASYWRFPIIESGKEIPLRDALTRFTDRTGRPGPAVWEAGTYPDGLADHPVAGVSWYEAAAYAAWAGKELPTVYHWAQMADVTSAEFFMPFSNFGGKTTTVVGSLPNISSYGVYDVAGNVREWVLNASGTVGERYILGGGFSDPIYAFTSGYAQPALDRSFTNGFRCIRELSGATTASALTRPLSKTFRDYAREQPADDRTFGQFARQFVYDRTPLDPRIERVAETDEWKLELVSVNAAYNGERLPLYIFLPPHAAPPFQPVVLIPGNDGVYNSHFDPHWIEGYRDFTFIMKSGRALIMPIFKGMFDRHDGLRSIIQDSSVSYRDHLVMWVKDFGRTIDYLETRKDIRADLVAYLGVSWGGSLGSVVPAVEKRIRVVVLNVGGFFTEHALPEADEINYAPRVTQPVLMLNGEYDNYFPLDASQKPLFRLLGTPPADKKMIVYPSGHLVPRVEFMKETLAWLDKYAVPSNRGGR